MGNATINNQEEKTFIRESISNLTTRPTYYQNSLSRLSICKIECGICQENFDEQERTPKILDCGHTFCYQCLMQIYERENQSSVICPFDRTQTFKSPQQISANLIVFATKYSDSEDSEDIDQNENMKENHVFAQKKCLMHSRETEYFCIECQQFGCANCMLFGDHKSHNFQDINQAQNLLVQKYQEMKVQVESFHFDLVQKSSKLKELLNFSELIYGHCVERLDRVSYEVKNQTEKSSSNLQDIIDEQYNNNMTSLTENLKDLQELVNIIEDFKIQNCADQEELIQLIIDIQEFYEESNLVINQQIQKQQNMLQFNFNKSQLELLTDQINQSVFVNLKQIQQNYEPFFFNFSEKQIYQLQNGKLERKNICEQFWKEFDAAYGCNQMFLEALNLVILTGGFGFETKDMATQQA